ncbi:MAG: methionine--tRNA ligase [Candidatus Woesearchaeota archaeon]
MPKKTFYITTAIDYPNAKPHVGHAYEKTVADALARWHRQNGEDVFFLTGSDENSLKIEEAAKAAGMSTQEFLEKMIPFFKELCKKLNLSNNDYIRTTEARHKKVAQEIFKKVYDKGEIYKGTYKGYYCVGCEAFITEKDLINGNCPVHQKPPKEIEEESYFFKMSKYQEALIKHIEQHPDFIQPEAKRNEILNRLKEPLRDLSVSRASTKWGIQTPIDKEHIIYVWFDALINYISGIDYPKAKFKKYWPANVHIIGKDIAWFHTVIWPCMLMAAGIELPKTVHCHGFINFKGEKLSKSRGIVIDPIKLVDEYGTDRVRYFFLKEIVAGEDGDFSYESLATVANADLGDALGNLLQRTAVMIHKYFNGEIPKPEKFEEIDNKLIEHSDILEATDQFMNKYEWHRAVEKIWDFIKACNKYINDTEPWKIQDQKRLATVLYTLVECLRIISIFTWPFIPETAEKLAKQIGQEIGTFKKAKFTKKTTGKLPKPEILVKKLEIKKEEDPFSTVNLKVAKVLNVKDMPDSDKLYILDIDLKDEKRILVAGLKQHLKPEEIKGKNIVIVSNLKPAKIRGVESKGMLLAAESKGKVTLLEALKSEPGEQVYIEGIEPGTEEITIEQFSKITLTTKDKKAIYKGKPLKTDKEEIFANIPDNARIR